MRTPLEALQQAVVHADSHRDPEESLLNGIRLGEGRAALSLLYRLRVYLRLSPEERSCINVDTFFSE